MKKPTTKRKDEHKLAPLIERFIDAASRYSYRPPEDKYGDYRERVAKGKVTTQLRQWTGPAIVESLHGLYSSAWMRRACHIRNFDEQIAAQLADALNNGDGSDEHWDNLIMLASQLANDSMVGASKFLHFCHPDRFPITDQYTRKLTGVPGRVPRDGVARREAYDYDDYLRAVHLVSHKHANIAIRWAEASFGYFVTTVRAIEAFIFYHAKAWDDDNDTFPNLTPFLDHSKPEI